MQTYVYYIAEKMPGALEMQRFAHPIHVGLVSARDHEAAYTAVLEARFQAVTPPNAGTGVCRHGKPIDTDITFTEAD